MKALQNWTSTQKIAFRFFFIFISLQILTQDFLGNWFGDSMFIFTLGDKVFAPFYLWINNHTFHFYYHKLDWTDFSETLTVIRDLFFLTLSTIGCLVWSYIDTEKTQYIKLDYWFRQVLSVCLACIMFTYGICKVFPVQMEMISFVDLHRTIGSLSPFSLLWTTLGYGTPYQIFSGLGEVVGAALVLSRRTRMFGLLVLTTIISNVIMLNYTYHIGVLELSTVIMMIIIYLLIPYLKNIWLFFFSNNTQKEYTILPHYAIATRWKRNLISGIAIFLVASCIISNTISDYFRYTSANDINKSRQCSEIKNFVVEKDTLKYMSEKDTIKWNFWSERIMENKRLVSLCVNNIDASKAYLLDRDSINHILKLVPFDKPKAKPIVFQYKYSDKNHWHLQGNYKNKNISVDLQHIKPDTILPLLKEKRVIYQIDQKQ